MNAVVSSPFERDFLHRIDSIFPIVDLAPERSRSPIIRRLVAHNNPKIGALAIGMNVKTMEAPKKTIANA
jgi:hypothetical protein